MTCQGKNSIKIKFLARLSWKSLFQNECFRTAAISEIQKQGLG